MTRSPDNVQTADQELLVSYLDGELDADQARQVEQRLVDDESFRQLLTRLRATWDMLDDLPQPTLDEAFTRTTVEMVAVRVSEESSPSSVANGVARRRLVIGMAAAVCLFAGFSTARFVQNRADQRLLRDLPVIEQVDMYTQIDDIEFLRRLADQGLFADDTLSEEVDDDQP